ncbi:MAG: 2-aminoethylphosphonate ABC transporter permease subunit, partial [Alicyclobacillus sp.]|nr:2-aminoethylphosphonate ABC transporter permease subunit [Alicyclobacillus sp.]
MFRRVQEPHHAAFLLLYFVFLVPVLFYPFVGLLRLAFGDTLGDLWVPMAAVFSSHEFWAAAAQSLRISLISTLLVGVIGSLIAMAIHFWPFRGSGVMTRAMELIVAFPSFLIAFSFIYLYGTRGAVTVGVQHLFRLRTPPFDFLYSQTGIIIAEVSYYLPFMIRPTLSVLEILDHRLLEAAASLGARPLLAWRRIVMPLTLPGITAGVILCFLLVLNEFGVLLVLGTQSTPTIPISIYNAAMVNLDLNTASVEALTMIVLIFLLYAVYRAILARTMNTAREAGLINARREPRDVRGVGRWGGRLVGVSTLVIFVLPIAVVVLSSVAESWMGTVLPVSYTLRWISQLGADDWRSVWTTLLTSTAVSALAVALGTWAAMLVARRNTFWSHALDAILMFPMAVPSVVVGLVILLAYHTPPLDLSNSGWIVILAQTLLVLPTCYRTMVASLEKIPPSYAEAAAGLGAAPWRITLFVTLPLMLPALRTGFALAFALSSGELGATMMVYPPGYVTGPVKVVQYVERGYY